MCRIRDQRILAVAIVDAPTSLLGIFCPNYE